MNIVFTGGGSGGHFYPVIAIVEELNKQIEKEHFLGVDIYYLSDDPFDERLLFENGVYFKRVRTGKFRRYFSLKNITDIFKTIFAVIKAIWQLYVLYPDVVVGKGGYASFPALFAARFLRIPVIIHESDSVPGKVNEWAGKFAERVAISYPGAEEYFPKEKTALTGNPIRKEILEPMQEGAYELLSLERDVPVILIVGGSQGAQLINDAILQTLTKLLPRYQILHQAGVGNVEEVRQTADALLAENEYRDRYKVFGFLDDMSLRMAAGVSELVISRAGSTIFEIAAWGLPSIIIPITNSNGDHQRTNAYTYARAGACEVIEEENFTPHVLSSEIDRIMGDEGIRTDMRAGAESFARTDAAEQIAEQIVLLLKEHQGKDQKS